MPLFWGISGTYMKHQSAFLHNFLIHLPWGKSLIGYSAVCFLIWSRQVFYLVNPPIVGKRGDWCDRSSVSWNHFTIQLCLVHLQVPKCFMLVQIFWASPKIYLHIVPVTNILCQTKRWFAFSKIGFCASTKFF